MEVGCPAAGSVKWQASGGGASERPRCTYAGFTAGFSRVYMYAGSGQRERQGSEDGELDVENVSIDTAHAASWHDHHQQQHPPPLATRAGHHRCHRRSAAPLADATVATRCRRSLAPQTPPLLAAGARHRRRRRHRPLALASDHHVPGCLARGSASHPRRAAPAPLAALILH